MSTKEVTKIFWEDGYIRVTLFRTANSPKDGHFFYLQNPGGVLIVWGVSLERFSKDLLQEIFEIFLNFYYEFFFFWGGGNILSNFCKNERGHVQTLVLS